MWNTQGKHKETHLNLDESRGNQTRDDKDQIFSPYRADTTDLQRQLIVVTDVTVKSFAQIRGFNKGIGGSTVPSKGGKVTHKHRNMFHKR